MFAMEMSQIREQYVKIKEIPIGVSSHHYSTFPSFIIAHIFSV